MAHGIGGHRDVNDYSNRSKENDKKIIARLLKYGKNYWRHFFIAIILTTLGTGAILIRPLILKTGIDDYMTPAINGEITQDYAINGIIKLGVFFLILIVLEFILNYGQRYLLEYTGKNIIKNIRQEVFDHIQNLPVSYFDKHSVGRIVTRVTNDTDAVNQMFTNVIVSLFKNILTIAGTLIVMFTLNYKLTLLVLTVMPIMIIFTIFFRNKVRVVFKNIRAKLAAINGFLAENIAGIHIIQIFNMQKKKIKEFDKINKDYYKATNRQVLIFGMFRPLMDVIKYMAISLLIFFGGKQILINALEIGTLYAFVEYVNKFFQPLMQLTDTYNTIQGSIVASERIFTLLDEREEKEPIILHKIDKLKGKIEFKHVWFAYNNEEWILKDVCFVINPGESAAFVGATGAGKTSIINLICGFYEHQKGDILLDGINIKNIRKAELRKNIGLVLQDVVLFSGDIRSNIKLFNKNITQKDVVKAAKSVNADEFIEKLEDGYDHKVNEKGTTLSTGQRQLLSFARALIIHPSILVMDEATSNIDTETETIIQKALANLIKGRTSITIAHRLSTIQKSDQIIVIHKGRIREKGNHQQLLNKGGLYYKLYQRGFATSA